MKRISIIIICLSLLFKTWGQIENNLKYCDCVDKIDQSDSVLNGNYQRICKGKLIESGEFIKGKKNGKWESYNLKGQLIRLFNYSSGKLNGNISLFYPNGKMKFTGSFVDGKQDGEWNFYNPKEDLIKTGIYKNGSPIGVWKVFDWKGKKELAVYDFDNKKYILPIKAGSYFADGGVLQDSYTEEWFILFYPERKDSYATKPFEGYILSNDLFVNITEVPLDFWDTYASFDYNAYFKFKDAQIESITLSDSSEHDKNIPLLPFIIITNDSTKLKHIEYSPLSKKLLEYKILESLWLMGPWLINDNSITINTPYVVNKIKNRNIYFK